MDASIYVTYIGLPLFFGAVYYLISSAASKASIDPQHAEVATLPLDSSEAKINKNTSYLEMPGALHCTTPQKTAAEFVRHVASDKNKGDFTSSEELYTEFSKDMVDYIAYDT